jgi:hypothetical protein
MNVQQSRSEIPLMIQIVSYLIFDHSKFDTSLSLDRHDVSWHHLCAEPVWRSLLSSTG